VSDVTGDALASYLGERLDADMTVTDLEEHVEGWSRDTVSFTAHWQDDGEECEKRYIVRAESDAQVESGRRSEGNDIETEYRTMDAAQDAPVPVPTTRWFEDGILVHYPFSDVSGVAISFGHDIGTELNTVLSVGTAYLDGR